MRSHGEYRRSSSTAQTRNLGLNRSEGVPGGDVNVPNNLVHSYETGEVAPGLGPTSVPQRTMPSRVCPRRGGKEDKMHT